PMPTSVSTTSEGRATGHAATVPTKVKHRPWGGEASSPAESQAPAPRTADTTYDSAPPAHPIPPASANPPSACSPKYQSAGSDLHRTHETPPAESAWSQQSAASWPTVA